MSDYKFHINTHFGHCVLIAKKRDEHRGRDVRMYHMPGNFEYVGIYDGTDAFIAPVAGFPFGLERRIFDDIRAGKQVGVVDETVQPKRVRKAPKTQRELELSPAPVMRIRIAPNAIAANGRVHVIPA